MKKTIFLYIVILCCVMACGKKQDDQIKHPHSQIPAQMVGDLTGQYRAVIRGITDSDFVDVYGTTTILISAQTLEIELHIEHLPVGKYHQGIYTSMKCPEHITANFGQLIIPLDEDLNSQSAGNSHTHRTGTNGSYFYQQSAELPLLLTDLYSADENDQDNIIKLNLDESFELGAKSIVIIDSEANIPVACGSIIRIKNE